MSSKTFGWCGPAHFGKLRDFHGEDSLNLYKTTKKRVDGKMVTEKTLLDSADHVYESTAAHGGTIFWKQSSHYLNVTKSKEWL